MVEKNWEYKWDYEVFTYFGWDPLTESVELISETVGCGDTGEVDEVPDERHYGFHLSVLS